MLSDIGYCFYLQQKMPEAENALNEAVKIDSSNETATNNLALVYGREGRYQESKTLFMRNNSEAETCANLAYVMAQNGETAKAKEMYLRALTLDNKMQVAAKAMLQIDEREQTMDRLASASPTRHPVAATTAKEAGRNVLRENDSAAPEVEELPMPVNTVNSDNRTS